MRVQATALLTMGEKAVLEELSRAHRTTLSTVLRAALLRFTAHPDEQAAWITIAENNREKPKDSLAIK